MRPAEEDTESLARLALWCSKMFECRGDGGVVLFGEDLCEAGACILFRAISNWQGHGAVQATAGNNGGHEFGLNFLAFWLVEIRYGEWVCYGREVNHPIVDQCFAPCEDVR